MLGPILMVSLEMENPTAEVQTVFLEKGRCFEIVHPTAGYQNAALAENIEVVIPPYKQVQIEIPAFCLNRYRHMTGRKDANVTPFLLSFRSNDQEEIWKRLARPAA